MSLRNIPDRIGLDRPGSRLYTLSHSKIYCKGTLRLSVTPEGPNESSSLEGPLRRTESAFLTSPASTPPDGYPFTATHFPSYGCGASYGG